MIAVSALVLALSLPASPADPPEVFVVSIGNGGRIDLRNTVTTLRATDPKNTPIGLEDDGHVLAEDAHVVIEGPNDAAIALQKASAFFCNDHTHFEAAGANQIAGVVATALRTQQSPLAAYLR